MNKTLEKISAGAAVALLLIPVIALASNANAGTARVKVGDLDLSRAEQAAVFDARVKSAAKPLCATYEISRVPGSACARAVKEEAVSKLGAEQKAALRQSQSAH